LGLNYQTTHRLPTDGSYWHFLKRHPKWSRFRKGDVAETRDTVPGFWSKGELGSIVSVHPFSDIQHPLGWERFSDKKKFDMQGWRLFKEVKDKDEASDLPTAETEATGKGDESQLPWQIVGINDNKDMWELRKVRTVWSGSGALCVW
jgi:hypothetical protein